MDYLVKMTAANAQIRAFACLTKESVEEARRAHNTSPVITAALGRLISAGCMMGSMLKGEEDLITLQVRGNGPVGGMTVTANAKGLVKGYANNPIVDLPANALGKLDVGGAVGKGYLQVIKDMGLKKPYVGQTSLQTGEIAEDLTYYFATSEQIPSSVGLGVLMEKNNTVKRAGGFIIQLLPFAEDSIVDRLEANLAKFDSVTACLDAGNMPEDMLSILLEGLEPEITDTVPIRFFCGCNKERVEKALISIGSAELDKMIDEGNNIEVNCHFCNRSYTFTVEDLKMIKERTRR